MLEATSGGGLLMVGLELLQGLLETVLVRRRAGLLGEGRDGNHGDAAREYNQRGHTGWEDGLVRWVMGGWELG